MTADGPRAHADTGLARFGAEFVRYSLVIVLIWVGALKFASYEAEAIAPLAMESPLLSWLLDIFSVETFALLLGIAEILAGVAIALRPVQPLLSALGSAFAVVLFAVTLSFLLTTPGVYTADGFPQLSPMPGQFLAKDLVLLAVAVWLLGESLAAVRARRSVVPGQVQASTR